jgi:hypothetical protein
LKLRAAEKHAHVFFVHSSITEILAHRIASDIADREPDISSFIYIVGRNYKCALLPLSTVYALDTSSNWLIGYEHSRGDIFDFLKSFDQTELLVKNLTSYTLYVPHTKLRIARALVVNSRCVDYYIIEEGLLSHLRPKKIKELFSARTPKNYTFRDNLYMLKTKIYALFKFLLFRGVNNKLLLGFYLFGCYNNPAGFYYFCRTKFAGLLAVLPQAFPGQHAHKILFQQPTQDELALLNQLMKNYVHLVGAPILLVHSSDSPQDIASSLQLLNDTAPVRFILRPHPSLLEYSLDEVCRMKQIDHTLVIADSSALLSFPLEMIVQSLGSPLINQGSSSISLYLKIYSPHVNSARYHSSGPIPIG